MRAVDLFAGAGGLALGLSKAGFDHNTLVEWDQYACATIRNNVKRRISGTEHWCLLENNVAEVKYSTVTGEVDLLSAGLPCQPFSVAGKGHAHRDHRDMFSEVVRAVREIRPKAMGAALFRRRPNQSLRRRRGRIQFDPSTCVVVMRKRRRGPSDGGTCAVSDRCGYPLVLARFVEGLSTIKAPAARGGLRAASRGRPAGRSFR